MPTLTSYGASDVRNAVLQREIAKHVRAPVIPHNSVRVVRDTAFFDEVAEDIDRSIGFVHGVTFVWGAGTATTMVSERLGEAARRRGVDVIWCVDGVGGKKGLPEDAERIVAGGGQFVEYNPV